MLAFNNSDIFGPKVQFMSCNSKIMKINENTAKKRDIHTLSNKKEGKNKTLPVSDQKVNKTVKKYNMSFLIKKKLFL